MPKRYRNGWWLVEKYHKEEWTQAEIANECGVSARAIRKWMKKRGVETREMVGENHPQHGTERSREVKRSISETMEGRDFPEHVRERIAEAKTGHTPSPGTREKISQELTGRKKSAETRRKMGESRVGEDNPNWRGGRVFRYGPGWTSARRRAREKVSRCVHCGHDGSDRQLDVHHIVPVRRFRDSENHELRDAHVQGNLVVLCRQCHMKAEHGNGDIKFEATLETTKPKPRDGSN